MRVCQFRAAQTGRVNERDAREREALVDERVPLRLGPRVNAFAEVQDQAGRRAVLQARRPSCRVRRRRAADLGDLRVDRVAGQTTRTVRVVQIADHAFGAERHRRGHALDRRGARNDFTQFRPLDHFALGFAERRLLGDLERLVAGVALPLVAIAVLLGVLPARQVVVGAMVVWIDQARRDDAVGAQHGGLVGVRRAAAVGANAEDLAGLGGEEDFAVVERDVAGPDRAAEADERRIAGDGDAVADGRRRVAAQAVTTGAVVGHADVRRTRVGRRARRKAAQGKEPPSGQEPGHRDTSVCAHSTLQARHPSTSTALPVESVTTSTAIATLAEDSAHPA